MGGANRLPNAAAMDNGLLSEIRYPTGGKTTLFFEPHDYAAATTNDQVIAGPVSNCASWGTLACCSTTDASLEYTFTAAELADASIKLTLFHNDATGDEQHTNQGQPNTSSPLMCNFFTDDAFLLLSIKETGGSQIGTNFEFNFNSYTPDNVIIGQEMLRKLSENVPTLQAGVSYTFSIETINGRGVLEIIKPSDSFTTQIVGGARIQKIVTHDGISNDNDQIRSFDYKLDNGNSSGNLQGYPQYGYFGVVNTGNSTADITYTLIKDNPFVPLQSFQGFAVGYQQVTEYEHHDGVMDGNGKTVYEYFVNETDHPVLGLASNPPTYPIVPANYIARNSPLKSQSIYHQNGTRLVYNQTDETVPSEPLQGLPAKVLRISSTPSCDPTGWTEDNMDQETGNIYSFYPIITSVFLPKTVTSNRENVPTVTTYTYNDLSNHLYPTIITEEISTGQKYITRNSYVFDEAAMQPNSAYSEMVERNIIATPIKTTEEVLIGGVTTQTRGSELKMAAFDKTTGQKVTCCANTDPRLAEIYNYEISWDENGTVLYSADDTDQDHWVLNKTHAQYDPLTGNPTKVVLTHWDTLHYEWNAQNKLLTSQRFKTHEKLIRYYPNTKLLSGITQIDGQIDSINYDGLIRAKEIWMKQGNVTTDFEYAYQLNGQNINSFKSITNYTPQTGSALVKKEIIDYQDGINRSIEQVHRQHSPNDTPKDIVTHQTYDDRGRPKQQYEPFKSNHETGQYAADTTGIPFTLQQYEPSPLNRTSETKLPNWYSTFFTYGANTSADAVMDYDNSSTFGANTLFKSTQIDGNGNQLVSFSDSRGKIQLNRRSDGNTANNDTYTLYDVKERKAAVYPPAANAATPNLIYEFLYDAADNQLLKKLPDAEKIDYVFNNRDLLIGMQSGNLRTDGKWMVTEYDDFGRNIKTGLNTSPTTVDETWTTSVYDGGSISFLNPFSSNNLNLNNPKINLGKITFATSTVLQGNQSKGITLLDFFNYDDFGRETAHQHRHHRGGWVIDGFKFDFADNVTQQDRIFYITEANIIEYKDTLTQTYDHQGRLLTTHHQLRGQPLQQISELAYTEKNELKTKFLGKTASDFLQEVNYSYLDNGFISGINADVTNNLNNSASARNAASADLFHLQINFDQANSNLNALAQKNGNISQLTWWTDNPNEKSTYGYEYDYLDRIKKATFGTINSSDLLSVTNGYNTAYSYDERGNILSLNRAGQYWTGSDWKTTTIDSLSYDVPITGNQFIKITDKAPCQDTLYQDKPIEVDGIFAADSALIISSIIDSNTTLSFQADSSITFLAGFHYAPSSKDSLVAKIDGCPEKHFETDGFVQRSDSLYRYDADGNLIKDPNKRLDIAYNYYNLPYQVTLDTTKKIEWLYDGSGTKLQKLVRKGDSTLIQQDYLGGIEYQQDSLEAIYLADARLVADTNQNLVYQYFLADHLGNNRVTFKDSSGVLKVVQENHYYPFGMEMEGNGVENTGREHRYKFNGFERNTDFGLGLDMAKYRTYDPAIARWLQIDPKQELFASWTPYKFGLNNPILFNDPNGDCEICKETLINGAIFVAAAGNSITSNLTGNFPGTRGNPSDFGAYANAAAIGQQTGDVLSLVAGTAGTILGAVAATGSSLTTPVTGPVGAGAAVAFGAGAVASAGVASTALSNLTGNNQIVKASSKGGKSGNKLQSDPDATGDHSTFRRDDNGDIFKHQEFKKNPRNPRGFDAGKRFDGGRQDGSPGAPHHGIPTPHVNEKIGKKSVARPARPDEIPNNNRFNK